MDIKGRWVNKQLSSSNIRKKQRRKPELHLCARACRRRGSACPVPEFTGSWVQWRVMCLLTYLLFFSGYLWVYPNLFCGVGTHDPSDISGDPALATWHNPPFSESKPSVYVFTGWPSPQLALWSFCLSFFSQRFVLTLRRLCKMFYPEQPSFKTTQSTPQSNFPF